MSIEWSQFTPFSALAGGAVLGGAVALLLLLNGRIAGISGIAAGLLRTPRTLAQSGWRAAFIAGLISAPLLYTALRGRPAVALADGPWLLAAAGLLTGLGTGLANGCTSGHAVCGLARLSPRSLVATLCFMATGFATVFCVRHLLPLQLP